MKPPPEIPIFTETQVVELCERAAERAVVRTLEAYDRAALEALRNELAPIKRGIAELVSNFALLQEQTRAHGKILAIAEPARRRKRTGTGT